ncbi:DUF4142 domain-containing protein [Micromonospora sp. NPDC049679]|uniref:DUF4142 domain-containing protein n=1 Tax=Micromonospora sp. NPDC049679 TaxID=3155920 RepID=UPI0033FEC632
MSRVARSGIAAVLVALALLPAAAAQAAPASRSDVPEQDKLFLQSAHQSHLAVMEAGKLAEEKATSMPIRDFGIRLVNDHAELDRNLSGAASKLRVSLPAGPTETQQAALEQLRAAEGTEFNAQFVLTEQEEHLRVRQTAETEIAQRSSDARAKRVAKESLPVLQAHEDALRDLSQSLGMSTAGSPSAAPEPSPTAATPSPAGSGAGGTPSPAGS